MNLDVYKAAHEAAAWRAMSHFGRFLFRGRDAAALLHHITTADVKNLKISETTEAALITSKARLLDLLTIVRLESEAFLVVTSPNRRDILLPHARRFILYRQEVTLEDITPNQALFGFFGPHATRVLSELGAPLEADWPPSQTRIFTHDGHEFYLSQTTRLPLNGVLLCADNDAAAQSLIAQSGAPLCDNETYNVLRIEGGVPVAGAELTEDFNPWEAGLSSAISLAKGCYNGQEIVARLNTYQKVKRQLRGLRLSTQADVGAVLKSENREVGVLTSAVQSPRFGDIALAYVRGDFADAGTVLEIESASATVCDLPFSDEK